MMNPSRLQLVLGQHVGEREDLKLDNVCKLQFAAFAPNCDCLRPSVYEHFAEHWAKWRATYFDASI